MPRPAILGCAVASVVAARFALPGPTPCLLVAWVWIWWLGVRPLAFRAVRHLRGEGLLGWALAPMALTLALWAAIWSGACDRVLLRLLPAEFVQQYMDKRAERVLVLESIQESLRRAARASRKGATE